MLMSSLKTALTWGGIVFVFFLTTLTIAGIALAVMEHRSIMGSLKKDFVDSLRNALSCGVMIATIRFLWDVLGAYW